uniref:purine-nucleoside phosphorylase n=1 Tax=Trichuris muris TaxID=70415 RepID=A0A5S6QC17_TRIMR
MDEETIKKAVRFLKDDIRATPTIGIVCGTGREDLSDHMKLCRSLRYNEIPGFPCPRGYGHPGSVIHGYLGQKYVVGMETRLRSFDGYPADLCAAPIVILRRLGVRTLIITAMASKLSEGYAAGDIMLVKDHIYIPGIFGNGVKVGEKDNRSGVKHFPKENMYNEKLRDLFHIAAQQVEHRPVLHDGIYAMIGGPACATETEMKFLRSLDADAVGMGICHEVVTAYGCGMEVVAVVVLGDQYGKYLQRRLDYETTVKYKQSSKQVLSIVAKLVNFL